MNSRRKLLKNCLADWLIMSSFEKELSFSEICRKESEINPELLLPKLWLRRPTRLFDIFKVYSKNQTQQFFCFFDQEIARLQFCLSYNCYSKHQIKVLKDYAHTFKESSLLEQLKSSPLKKHCAPFVPLFIRGKNQNSLPQIIFDHFIEYELADLSEGIYKHDPECQKVQRLFKKMYRSAETVSVILPVKSLPASQIKSTGNSHLMALWVYLWIRHHQIDELPVLCCTGKIDSITGEILSVQNISSKIKFALESGFEYVLVPADNLEDEFLKDPRVICLGNVEELNNWLLMNSGNGPGNRRVIAWLKTERKTPCNDDFSSYFKTIEFQQGSLNVAAGTILQRHSQKYRFLTLKTFVEKFNELSGNSYTWFHKIVPEFLSFVTLPWELTNLKKSCGKKAEQLYLNFCEKFLSSQPEIFLAANFIKTCRFEKLYEKNIFIDTRKRFPALLWLFFRDPVEMLHVFSKLPDQSPFEKNMLDFLCNQLNDKREDYCSVTSGKRADALIMNQMTRFIDAEANFIPGTELQVRKRLPLLLKTSRNFLQKYLAEKDTLYVRASQTALWLLKNHIVRYAKKSSIDCSSLLERIENPDEIVSLPAKVRNDPVLSRFSKILSDKTIEAFFVKEFPGNPKKPFLNNIKRKADDFAWMPQPGTVFIDALLNGNLVFNWQRVLKQFSADICFEPSLELLTFCLAHWVGVMTSKLSDQQKISESLAKLRIDKRFSRSCIAGVASYLSKTCTDRECKNNKNCPVAKAFIYNSTRDWFEHWFYFLLPAKCRNCLDTAMVRRFENTVQKVSKEESNSKNYIAQMFFGAILAESQPTSILVDCARMFENRTFDFFKKPEAIRKTFRAFIPVYLTFRRELKKRNDVMNLLSQQLNNSRFACEYLETFYFRKSVLRFISWNNSLEKQIYNSLCLGSLAVERSDEFVDFVHACVDDINNHSRAFNLYDKFFT